MNIGKKKKYCPHCNKTVGAKLDFSLFWFIVGGMCTAGIWCAFHILFIMIKPLECPICNNDIQRWGGSKKPLKG